MSIPDKAVEAGGRIIAEHQYQWPHLDEANRAILAEGWKPAARAVLEAAEPYLTGESELREGLLALTGDLVARAEDGEPHLSLTVRLRDLEALLAAHPEVKS